MASLYIQFVKVQAAFQGPGKHTSFQCIIVCFENGNTHQNSNRLNYLSFPTQSSLNPDSLA